MSDIELSILESTGIYLFIVCMPHLQHMFVNVPKPSYNVDQVNANSRFVLHKIVGSIS